MSIPKCPDKEFTILPIGMDKEPVVPSLRCPKWPRQPPEDSSSCRGYSCYGLSISVSALVLLSMGANRMGDILIRVLTCVHFSRVGGGLWSGIAAMQECGPRGLARPRSGLTRCGSSW